MPTKNTTTKTEFRRDITYIRNVLRQAEQAISKGDWIDLEDCFREIGGVAGNNEMFANENAR